MPSLPSQSRIILVRHGETEANRLRRFAESDDIPLTDEGSHQAEALALRIRREFEPELLLSSPFHRARQTSEIIGRVLGLEPEVLAGMQERDFGSLRGEPYGRMPEMMAADPAYDPLCPWLWCPAGGESLHHVRERCIPHLDAARLRPAREIVLVCHGAVIQAICAHITGQWRDSHVPPNCGFVVVDYSPEGWHAPLPSGEWESLDQTKR